MFRHKSRARCHWAVVAVLMCKCSSSDVGSESCQHVTHSATGSALLQRPWFPGVVPQQPSLGLYTSPFSLSAQTLALPSSIRQTPTAELSGFPPLPQMQQGPIVDNLQMSPMISLQASSPYPGQGQAGIADFETNLMSGSMAINENPASLLLSRQSGHIGVGGYPGQSLPGTFVPNANFGSVPTVEQQMQVGLASYQAIAAEAIAAANRWKDAATNLSIQMGFERQHSQALESIASQSAEALTQQSSKTLEINGKLQKAQEQLEEAKEHAATAELQARSARAETAREVEDALKQERLQDALTQERLQEEFAQRVQKDSEERLERFRAQAAKRIREAELETWRTQQSSAQAVEKMKESAEAAMARANEAVAASSDSRNDRARYYHHASY